MEKIIITPNEVRALGNIVSPKSKNDFIGSKIVQSTATVQGIPSTIYTSTFLPISQLSVTGEHYIQSDKPLTLEITVTDNNNAPVRSGRVYCTVNNKEYSHSLNSDGTCELKIPRQPDGLHTLKIYYPGTSNLGGSFRNFTVVWGDELVLDLFGTSKLVQPDSYSELFGTLSSGDVGVPGVRVEFFEEYILSRINAFASTDIMQTGEDIDISARLSDIDGSGVADQLVDFYEEFDINFNLSASPSLIQTSGYSEVTAQLSDADGSPIRDQEVKFYEVYASRFLRGHVSSDIVQPEGVVEVYAILSDRDGSRIPDKKIKFYEEFDYSNVTVLSSTRVIQQNGNLDISARLQDEDGSLIPDEKVDFYEGYDYVLSVESDKSVVVADEDCTVSVSVIDRYGEPVPDVMFRLLGNNAILDTLVSDEHGKASYTYTGTGAGKLVFVAKYRSLLSDECVVVDATLVDKGVSSDYNDIWYNQQYTSVERKTNYTELSENGGTLIYRLSQGNAFAKANNCIELDFYQADGTTTNAVFLIQSSNGTSLATAGLNSLGLSAGEWHHIKFEFDEGGVTINGNVRRNYTPTDTLRFGFLSNGDITKILFRNFMLYTI